MIKKVLEEIKFVMEILVSFIYMITLDFSYQIKFSRFRGEYIVTYTKYQSVLAAMFYPLLIIGIMIYGLMFYSYYLNSVRRKKSRKTA